MRRGPSSHLQRMRLEPARVSEAGEQHSVAMGSASGEATPVMVDHDGFVEAFYHLLWAKNFNGEPCKVLVPDVIIYKYRIPVSASPRVGECPPARTRAPDRARAEC